MRYKTVENSNVNSSVNSNRDRTGHSIHRLTGRHNIHSSLLSTT